ncbi:MAG: ATP-dependent DNA helicase PcrA [Anaerolineales bacterium]|nr:ATP-dependent DNA helicase PcrA [Anaerolineae bacterium]PWB69393.1 MAG: ATP-dependent DNA helicase PcrA [Anaerolineales bacterium]
MDFLDKLNKQQRMAVTAGDGPVLVVAGPGSGKTRVLTQRIAYLIAEEGVRPWQILAVTFTNKAAKEMQERVRKLLPDQAIEGIMLGTFHSICARILRREADHLPIESNFVIFDSDDQERLVKSVIRELNINEKLYRPASVHAAISRAKNELIDAEHYPTTTYRDEVVKRVYAEYQKRLIASNAVDFDDMLVYTAKLLEDNPSVSDKYAQRFRHVLVDEFQDTNLAQYALVKELASHHKNIFCVGDPDQCFPAGTQIQIPNGSRKIEILKKGDQVIAASGRGSTMVSQVSHIGKRVFKGNLVKAITQSGHVIKVTPNHIVFARLGMNQGLHYVYLMYRKDKGYRIGIASHARSDGNGLKTGLQVRGNQENADKIWVLKVCRDRAEAHYWEAFFSTTYGIPTLVFHVRGRRMRMSQEYIDKLFNEIDTDSNANQLMTELGMDLRYPHYIPQGTFRNIVNLRYFGDGRITEESPWHAHRVDLWSSDPKLAKQLKELGFNPRIRSRNNWRVGINRLRYDDIQISAQKLSEAANHAEIVIGAFLVDKGKSSIAQKFNLMPASHLHPSMIVAIMKDGKIIEDEIIEISHEPYQGTVYDLEVENLHNYIANGMVVHNSIYAWRGADWRNIQRFEQDFPEAQTILLEQNYRSKQTILDAAMGVIDRAQNRRRKQLFTDRGKGENIFFYEAPDDYAEASFVVDTIAQLVASSQFEPGDCAVMYRTNAMSRLLEEAFLQARLPYRLVGAQRFYGRREVKDIIAFLRLVHNPADEASLDRVINVPPRGIGEKTLTTLHMVARQKDLQPGEVLIDLARGADSPYWSSFTGRASISLADIGGMLAAWRIAAQTLTIPELFDRILSDINYKEYIDDNSEEGEDRWENVQELRRLALEYSTRTLDEFLENVALVSDQDTITEGNVPTLLTLHAAKGLEFGAVFIIGLDDGILPHSRSFDEPEQMEEERRLFYVGITRAKDKLYLIRAIQRGGRGSFEEAYPSRFLDDVPADLLAGRTRTGRNLRGGVPESRWGATEGSAETKWSLHTRPKTASVIESKYRAGTHVKHPTWGEGIVLDSRIQDDDEIVDVVFNSVGIKRLSASLANLKII